MRKIILSLSVICGIAATASAQVDSVFFNGNNGFSDSTANTQGMDEQTLVSESIDSLFALYYIKNTINSKWVLVFPAYIYTFNIFAPRKTFCSNKRLPRFIIC